MDRFWKCLALLFVIGAPLWYGPIIYHDIEELTGGSAYNALPIRTFSVIPNHQGFRCGPERM